MRAPPKPAPAKATASKEQKDAAERKSAEGKDSKDSKNSKQMMPLVLGGGVTAALFEALAQTQPQSKDKPAASASGVDCVGIVWYCAEGDNTAEGITMARTLDALLRAHHSTATATTSLPDTAWKVPPSWEFVFGGAADETSGTYI